MSKAMAGLPGSKSPARSELCHVSARCSVSESWTRALIAAGPSTGHGQLNGR